MLKSQSEAWKLATRIARRKHTNWTPVALSADGNTVTVQSLIRGNQWTHTLSELRTRAR